MTDLDEDLFQRVQSFVGRLVRLHTRAGRTRLGRVVGVRVNDATHELTVELDDGGLHLEPTGIVSLEYP